MNANTDDAVFHKMKVKDLKQLLRANRQPVKGNKPELIARAKQTLQSLARNALIAVRDPAVGGTGVDRNTGGNMRSGGTDQMDRARGSNPVNSGHSEPDITVKCEPVTDDDDDDCMIIDEEVDEPKERSPALQPSDDRFNAVEEPATVPAPSTAEAREYHGVGIAKAEPDFAESVNEPSVVTNPQLQPNATESKGGFCITVWAPDSNMLEGLDTEDVEGPQPHFLHAKNDIVTTETKSIDFTNIENVSLGNVTVDQNRHIIGAKQEGIQYPDQTVSGHGSDVSWAPPVQVTNALRQTQSGGDQTPSRGPPTVNVSNSPQPATPAGFYRCGFQGCSFGTLLSGDFGNHLSNSHSSSERFPCSHCGCEEHNADSLLEHFNHHLDEMSRSYFCTEVCEFNSRDVDEVISHILLAHPDTRNIICWSCGDRYESIQNFLSHVKDNTLRIVRCSYCTAKDTHENRLFQHMALSHPYKPRSIRSEKVLLCQERKKWGFRQRHQTSLFSFPPTPDDTRSSFSATGKSPKSERIPHQARGCPPRESTAPNDADDDVVILDSPQEADEGFEEEPAQSQESTGGLFGQASFADGLGRMDDPEPSTSTGRSGLRNTPSTCRKGPKQKGPRSREAIEAQVRSRMRYKPFCCPHCEFKTGSMNKIRDHMKKSHASQRNKDIITNKDPEKERNMKSLVDEKIARQQKQ